MTDFEHSLRVAIKNNFPDIKIRACYFHYAKAIYKKCKQYHLFTKKRKRDTFIISFSLKIFPYIPKYLREEYFKKITNYVKYLDNDYNKLISYFEKYWKNSKFFNFSEINDDDISKRTNNICESFHRYINNTISHYHPKIGYLLIILGEYIFKSYKNYFNRLIKKSNTDIEKIDIFEDILELLKKFKVVVKKNFDIDTFNDNFKNIKDDLENLFKSLLNTIYDELIIFLAISFILNQKRIIIIRVK
jgi:hypothetical protein